MIRHSSNQPDVMAVKKERDAVKQERLTVKKEIAKVKRERVKIETTGLEYTPQHTKHSMNGKSRGHRRSRAGTGEWGKRMAAMKKAFIDHFASLQTSSQEQVRTFA